MLPKHRQQYLSEEPERPQLAIVRHNQVKRKLQVSSAKLYAMVADGLFPRPFQLIPGGRAKGWLEDDVNQWILSRKKASLPLDEIKIHVDCPLEDTVGSQRQSRNDRSRKLVQQRNAK